MTRKPYDLSSVDLLGLIRYDVELKRVASTSGGEYAGACPFCHDGTDRFRVWPYHPDGKGRYWCRRCHKSGDAIQYLRDYRKLTFKEAVEFLGVSDKRLETPRRITARSKKKPSSPTRKPKRKYDYSEEVARYTYEDEQGNPLFQVRRVHYYLDGQRIKKAFFQYHYYNGDWKRGVKGVRRVLFRLPEVLAAVRTGEVIYIVEGEQSVMALVDRGVTATCNPMGAQKWDDSYTKALNGAKVVILPDNDESGRAHAHRVAEALYGQADQIKVVELLGLEEKEDVVDWFKMGLKLSDLKTLVQMTAEWKPPQNAITADKPLINC